MNENQQNEKSYWEEWEEESKRIAIVFDGQDYWTALLREKQEAGNVPVFELQSKLKEELFGSWTINGKRYKEAENG